ncbi:DNA mismatch repair protein MutS [Erythrobacter sp. SG61-1L]|uniref:Smr/MutS family protein n=1 Tax=Erythrobacter sp. SG61-1L TaxID=1603897 RepID=UPI0006C901DD|nr:Smr/MutS family protein [Erythrobacter sp. SG61-1L]KPL68745.1 DNA mismatch repair protein MutS [Erythrobacter sp. SG61-1L]
MRTPRGLSLEEKALWQRVASTVKPLHPKPPRTGQGNQSQAGEAVRTAVAPLPPKPQPKAIKGRVPAPLPPKATPAPRQTLHDRHGLDSSWERKLKGARIDPDFTLDLHGHTLDEAHVRLDRGLSQAKAMGARLVLVVTGKSRPVEHADRGERRGAIRAKVLDWLAAGPHGPDIAAVRGAHRRHGGDGAIYIVLRRGR